MEGEDMENEALESKWVRLPQGFKFHLSNSLKWFTGLFLIIIFIIPNTASSAELSFDQAQAKLLKMNEAILAARMEENQRMHERSAARGLYFPKLTANSSYTRINDPITIDLNDIRTLMLTLHSNIPQERVPSFEMTVQDDQFWRLSANLTWPVYTGGRIQAANRAAEIKVKESSEKLRHSKSSLISELVRRYFGLRLAQVVVNVRKQVLEGMEKHLFQAAKLEENGLIARSEKLHAEVARAEADREFKRAVRDVQIVQIALNNILSSSTQIVPISPLFIIKKIEPLADFQQQAILLNPVLKQITLKKELAHQGYLKEKGVFFPEVYLFGTKELYTDDLTMLDPEWALGVGANLTLFEGKARFNRLSAARDLEKKVSFLEQKDRRDIEALVEKQYHRLMKAMEQLESLEVAYGFAEEYLRVRNRAFKEGLATSFDVVDAQLAFSRVKTERLNAVYEIDTALAELLEASGQSERFESYRIRSNEEVKF